MSKLTQIINGVEWHTYAVEYRHDGATCGFDIMATSAEDARRRLRSIAGNGEIVGKIEGRIAAYPGAGLWVRFRCWWGNLFRS